MKKAVIKLPVEMKSRVIDAAKYYFKGDISRVLHLQTGMNTEHGSMINEFQRDPDTEFYKSADLFVIGGRKDSLGNNYTVYGISESEPNPNKHKIVFFDKDGTEEIFYEPSPQKPDN